MLCFKFVMVRTGRVELPRLAALEPKSSASANSATFAYRLSKYNNPGSIESLWYDGKVESVAQLVAASHF